MSEVQKRIKLIMFDLDGTIADSLQIGYELYQEAAAKYNLKPIKTFEEYQHLLQLSLPGILLKLRIWPWKAARIMRENKKYALERFLKAEAFPGIKEVCEELSQTYTLVIVSASLSFAIKKFLEAHDLEKYFSSIYGSDQHRNKRIAIRECLREFNVDHKKAIFIGDSSRDMEDAIELDRIAVTWGIHSEEELRKHNPTAIAHKPTEIPEAVKTIVEHAQMGN